MKLYADRRSRALRQAGCDGLTLAWITAWVWLGLHVRGQVSGATTGARKIDKSGDDLAGHLHDAARVLRPTPLIGDRIRKPVDRSADAATSLQHAGGQLADNLDPRAAARWRAGDEETVTALADAYLDHLGLREGVSGPAGRPEKGADPPRTAARWRRRRAPDRRCGCP